MSKVIDMRMPVFITSQKSEDVVLISKADYDGMQETLHLLSSPKNAQRLKEALEEYERGGGIHKSIIEE